MFSVGLSFLLLPVFMMCFTFFSMPFVVLNAVALVITIFCLYSLYLSERNNYFKIHGLVKYWPLLLVSLLASYICLMLPFASHCWTRHYATINLLTESTWPPVTELDGEKYFLRYYLSWFMLPVLSAKILGSQFITAATFIFTAVSLLVAMLLIFSNLHKVQHLFVAALVFLFFSGFDIAGAYLTGYTDPFSPHWLHWWAGERVLAILPNIAHLQYAAQHAIAAFLSTGLFLNNRHYAVKWGALIIVSTTMWSAFCAIGLLPIAAYTLFKEGWKTAVTPQNFLAAPLLAIVSVLYLTQEAGQVTYAFTWSISNFSFYSFLLFLFFEFLLILAVFYYFMKEERPLITIFAVFLTVFCAFKIGLWNDLLLRVSMPAICIMSIWMLKCILLHKGWSREFFIVYLLVGTLPVVITLTMGLNAPSANRNATFKQYLDGRQPDERDIYRNQNLVSVASARRVLGIPLMRNLNAAEGL